MTAAIVLGSLGLVLFVIGLVLLIPYLTQADIDNFNPIQKNLDTFYYEFEKALNNNGWDQAQASAFIGQIKPYIRHFFDFLIAQTAFFGVASLLLIIGAKVENQWLILPYLILQMLFIIELILAGVGVPIALYYFKVITGAKLAVVNICVLISVALSLYLWILVQKAYQTV